MKRTLWLLIALSLAPLAVALHAADKPAKRPNVVLFLVDDMGWMDCGAYGSQFYQTPHMDAFAKQAMRFTDAYSMPLCSPTRASILSGQYSARHGVTSASGHTPPVKASLQAAAPPNSPWLMPQSGSYLDPAQVTLAEALRGAGYKTAHIGKWHLGLTEPYWPEAQGFDVAFHCHPDPGPPGGYFSPYGVTPPGSPRAKNKAGKNVVGTITDGPDGEYIVDRLATEAEKFLEAHQDGPFFLNLWCYGVHGPWGHKEAYAAEFAKKTDPRGLQGNPIMASMFGLAGLLSNLAITPWLVSWSLSPDDPSARWRRIATLLAIVITAVATLGVVIVLAVSGPNGRELGKIMCSAGAFGVVFSTLLVGVLASLRRRSFRLIRLPPTEATSPQLSTSWASRDWLAPLGVLTVLSLIPLGIAGERLRVTRQWLSEFQELERTTQELGGTARLDNDWDGEVAMVFLPHAPIADDELRSRH